MEKMNMYTNNQKMRFFKGITPSKTTRFVRSPYEVIGFWMQMDVHDMLRMPNIHSPNSGRPSSASIQYERVPISKYKDVFWPVLYSYNMPIAVKFVSKGKEKKVAALIVHDGCSTVTTNSHIRDTVFNADTDRIIRVHDLEGIGDGGWGKGEIEAILRDIKHTRTKIPKARQNKRWLARDVLTCAAQIETIKELCGIRRKPIDVSAEQELHEYFLCQEKLSDNNPRYG
jgi:hypothetical protein